MAKNIFISHSWKYSDDYNKLKQLLENRGNFNFSDYSVSEENPLPTTNDTQLRTQLDNRIRNASIVIISAGVYATSSKWINEEIKIAKKYGKPILAIKPYGNINTSRLTDDANETVNWNTESIVNAIRRLW
ncbi:hypothetical protein RyT2_06290 [Pseudolactococcus yaeyamensis]